MSFNMPNPSIPDSRVQGMADDVAIEADGQEQERGYAQLQAEQARGRADEVERLSFRERWRRRIHRWADGGSNGSWGN
jgi:hypothetical protein